jgi:DNA repair protein RecN (Recombination protein N)
MLLELSINDFAIIERTTIRLSEGLNVLTGETGAGKSILLDALGAVLGARVSSDLVRTNASLARVEAAFEIEGKLADRLRAPLAEIGIDIDAEGTIILSREIQSNGRSSARINGRLTSANTLSQIGSLLVDIHGQSDHLAILKSGEQRNLLDRFAGLEATRLALGERVHEWRSVRNRIDELSRNSREREQRIDLLRFQVDEIDAANLVPGEDVSIAVERDVLRNADRLRADALEGLTILVDDNGADGGDVSSLLRILTARTADIAALDSGAAELEERSNEILVLAEDLARDLRSYAENVESDEQRLADIDDRVAVIQALKRKYGATIEEILLFADEARSALSELSSAEFDITALQERIASLELSLSSAAMKLSRARVKAAEELAAAIEQSIADLAMGSAQIRIDASQRPDAAGIAIKIDGETRTVHLDESGIDDIQFMIAPNAGEALKPLTRIASGGETARLMLATKSILSEVDLTPTLVFDEIDVGVGGRSGQVVGEKLWGIARQHQVIVVTHLPQIAAFAQNHLRIEKHAAGDRTVSDVRSLELADRELEIAAMIDGLPPGEAARLNAKTMLERSLEFIRSAH